MGTTELTSLYRARLGQANTALLARIAALWAATYDPADPAGSIALIATAAASLVTGGQAVAAADAVAYLRALTADAAAEQLAAVDPYAVPAGLVGSTAAGIPMGQLTGLAPGMYRSALAAGGDHAQAASAAYGWLNRVGASEPYRAANTAVHTNAATDDRLTGRVKRITRPSACDFCTRIADRGYIQANAGFKAHAHCGCTASPEVSSHVYSRKAIARAQRAYAGPVIPAPRPAPAPAVLTPRQREGYVYQLDGFAGEPSMEQAAQQGVDAALAPLAPGHRAGFAGVQRLGDAEFMASAPKMDTAWAYYTNGTGQVKVRGPVGTPASEEQTTRIEKSGWWTPTGRKQRGVKYKSAGALQRTLAHEVGHYVDDRLTYAQRMDVMRAAAAADPAASAKKTAAKVISKYGATNAAEMFAECWAEYTLSPAPRPVAKAVGDKIVSFLGDLAGPGAVPGMHPLLLARLHLVPRGHPRGHRRVRCRPPGQPGR